MQAVDLNKNVKKYEKLLSNVLKSDFVVKEARHLLPDRNSYSGKRNKITAFLNHDAIIVVRSGV
jgi:hypothetical protein